MAAALKRGREVEFPLGKLKRVKKLSKEWLRVGDEPLRPYTVEHELDEAGDRLLNGSEATAGGRCPGAGKVVSNSPFAATFGKVLIIERAAKATKSRKVVRNSLDFVGNVLIPPLSLLFPNQYFYRRLSSTHSKVIRVVTPPSRAAAQTGIKRRPLTLPGVHPDQRKPS
jgi:hypothetical protein